MLKLHFPFVYDIKVRGQSFYYLLYTTRILYTSRILYIIYTVYIIITDEMTWTLINLKLSLDLQYLMKSCRTLKGGLQEVADELQIERLGQQHQAGSDSLVTGLTFFKMKEVLLLYYICWKLINIVMIRNLCIYNFADVFRR